MGSQKLDVTERLNYMMTSEVSLAMGREQK